MDFNFFKKHKAKRQQPMRRSYAAAKIDRLTNSWTTTQQNINKDLQSGGKVLRARARDLSINNDYAKKYLQMVVSNVVGAKGILLQLSKHGCNGQNLKIARGMAAFHLLKCSAYLLRVLLEMARHFVALFTMILSLVLSCNF